MSATGIKSTSFHVWGASFASGLAAEVYALSKQHISLAAAGLAVQAIAGLVKTLHDGQLRATALKVGKDLEAVVINDITQV